MSKKPETAYYLLLQGSHVDNDYREEPDENGKYPDRVYHRDGDRIVESAIDLVDKCNSPGCKKFKYIEDDTPVEDEDSDTVKMSEVKEEDEQKESAINLSELSNTRLRKLAKEKGIDLGSATTRREIIAVIEAANQ